MKATESIPSPVFPASSPAPAEEPAPPVKGNADRGANDALTLYLKEVGAVPMLTLEQENELARRIHAGDDAARDHMIRANLRFVVKIARDYDNLGLPLLDLINEGNIGLMKAVDRFDPAKGAKLSTYSSLWIRQQIRRAIAGQGKTIRLPINAVDQIYHLRRAEVKLRELLGREPEDQELAKEANLSLRRLGELREAGVRPTSLDAALGADDSTTLAEIVADERAVNPAQAADDDSSLSRLGALIDRLPERESAIIRSRFGLGGGSEKTLESIGEALGVTRERIRQLQNLALQRLRRMLEDTGIGASPA